MKFSLTDVSKQQLRKQGFLSSSVVINKDMILLFKVDKDVILDNHNHPHAQLGYCFKGDFDFEVEGDHFNVTKGHSYLLQGKVYHSAVATTDYYSMDIKVLLDNPELPQRMTQNVFEPEEETEQYLLTIAQLGNCTVKKITFHQPCTVDVSKDKGRKQYVVVSEPCTLHFANLTTDLFMDPMKIYQLDIEALKFAIEVNKKDVEILLIEY